ncbi:MAG TPA: glycoside hydrolase family 38 C-terminal domain-containing protein [Propionibacteriaceae bacterium]
MHTQLSSLPARTAKTHERIKDNVYGRRVPATILVNHLPGEPVGFEEATAGDFVPFQLGATWGRGWATSWFQLTVTKPADGGGRWELVVDPGFTATSPGFQAEGLFWSTDGLPLKGLNPLNGYLPLPDLAPGETYTVYLEAASNPPVHRNADTSYSDLDTTPDTPIYTFRVAELAELNEEVYALDLDLAVLNELQGELPIGPRKALINTAIEKALDALDVRDVAGTAAAARAALAPALASPAAENEHTISAVGHAHIDSAWLWPIRETMRKCARTFSNVATLAADYPELVFACSQVIQYAWMRDHYPEVFRRIKEAIAAGNWAPVSGMWVECDSNLPGGEAMVRQFTYGKRFLADELGTQVNEVWLPDTFGYSGALPQIARLAEGRWFMSQKMSWNTTDVFPHHTFRWEGIDGTRIFTHFPPSDTYNAQIFGQELARSARNFKDAGPANRSLMAFGHGDGGGGPTREMMERARRVANLEGSPKVVIEKPRDFFAKAEAEYGEAPVWVGEMYLEFHRGTYTTHVNVKQSNRRTEHQLFEAELWATTATLLTGADYPFDELDELWREALLNQFHDILPGSSIRWVYRDARNSYEMLNEHVEKVIADALTALGGASEQGKAVANAAPHVRGGVAAFGAGPADVAGITPVQREADSYVLDNGLVRVVVGPDGTIDSIRDLVADRELVPAGAKANLLQLHPDFPITYEAWDIDEYYRHTKTDLTDLDEITIEGDEVVVRRSFDNSTATQRVRLDADSPRIDIITEVDWHERERLLKLAFPLDLHTTTSSSEIQFGYVTRPTHANTSWDAAKFETAAQRWVHVAEGSYGVAVVNKGTYGHDISRPPAGESRSSLPTTVRLSLVRGPMYPDPLADEGKHTFECSLLVGDIGDATREGYAKALPLRLVAAPFDPVVTCSNPDVVVSAVKLADDRSGDVIVRVYESRGARATTELGFGFSHGGVSVVNLLERTDGESETLTEIEQTDDGVRLRLHPFQISTLRVKLT